MMTDFFLIPIPGTEALSRSDLSAVRDVLLTFGFMAKKYNQEDDDSGFLDKKTYD